MKVCYVSNALEETDFNDLFKNSKKTPGQQSQRYNRLLMKGLKDNGVEVETISAPPITRNNIDKLFIKLKNKYIDHIKYNYAIVINIPVIKNLLFTMYGFFAGLRLLKNADSYLICDILNGSISLGATLAARIKKRHIVGIVTDAPELMVTGHSKLQCSICYRVIERCSGYIFLTEAINQKINKDRKPYTIIEGICEEQKCDVLRKPNGVKKIFYAGFLDENYGVKNLVEGFLKLNFPNTQLTIYGDGPYKSELTKIEDDKVYYGGNLLNSKILVLEREADLLVNPRPNDRAFTLYTFPSKLIEYMSSGVPTLTTRLNGIPEEYYSYVYSIDDYSTDGIMQSLSCVLSKGEKELRDKGIEARHFVLFNKNPKKQAEKAIKLLLSLVHKL